MSHKISRRSFARKSAIFSAPFILPTSARGANERLNLGVIGVGGKGASNLASVGSENIVAVCDVDKNRLAGAKNRHPNAVEYTDYRKLIERTDIDAVVVTVPDHNHAPATLRALRSGKHVYCEKPFFEGQEMEVYSETGGDFEFDGGDKSLGSGISCR